MTSHESLQIREDFSLKYTVCPGSSNPFYIVSYNINGSLLPGHIVQQLCDYCDLDIPGTLRKSSRYLPQGYQQYQSYC